MVSILQDRFVGGQKVFHESEVAFCSRFVNAAFASDARARGGLLGESELRCRRRMCSGRRGWTSDKNAAGSHLGSSSSSSLALFIFSDFLQPFCFSCLSSFDENADTGGGGGHGGGKAKAKRGRIWNRNGAKSKKWWWWWWW